MRKPIVNWLLYSLFIVLSNLLFAGCGGGGNPETPNEPIARFKSFTGNSVTLGDLQGYNVYLLLYGSNKDEGDLYTSGSFESIDTIMTYTQNSLASPSTSSNPSLKPVIPSLLSVPQASFEAKLRQSESEIFKHRPAPAKSGLSAAAAPTVGESRNFYIAYNSNFDKTSRTFVCRLKTANAYFWVDSGDTTNNTVLNSYATAFNNVYSTDQSVFGNHWDSDGEPVYILISMMLNDVFGGYFWAGDKFDLPESNHHDMFYVASESPVNYAMSTLAHEFQHMINFDRHYQSSAISAESYWLNESLSELAAFVCGYGDANFFKVQAFLSDSYYLTYWQQDIANYGFSLLFGRYLYEKYPNSIKGLVNTNKTGIANVEAATGRDFNALVKDFFYAVIFDNTGLINNSAYEFSTLNLRDSAHNFYGIYAGNIPEFPMATTTMNTSYPPYFLNLTKLTGIGPDSSISWTTTNDAPLDGVIIYLPAENSL